ncbi:MAG: hypothetical protein GWN67_28345 [Phycisphaerae bacterium]|nr:hypothetical protein [Phycisphaerae bacterium]NIP56218.1 hypothetical protein [Phycisphaerae bacterium]NIS54676.1 hypothetical protein [Phycisphaerae bacterium]NIU12266.1 hypothetical protein [Phycisphaerae bacterium]NIU60129.1 hypothetical protein [Phycisphaerae bacterium]
MAAKKCLKTTGAIILLLVLVVTSTAVQADIIYVDTDATGNDDGTSWTDAYNYLQDALIDDAGSGDEIWVAEGTYYPDEGDTPTNDDRTETFLLVDDVGIYGGFDATETARSQRDWVNNVTILSGDIGTSGVDTDNSYHVISNTDPTGTDTIVDGFTITKGYADGSSHPANTGGGIYIDEYYSPVTFKNCVISDNYSSNDGGGIYVTSHPDYSPTIIDSTITGNKSQFLRGGGAHVIHRLDLNGCTISDNEVGTSIYPGVGGGISYLGRGWGSKITNCIFKNNISDSDGGALFLGVVMETQVFKMEISNCVFSGNDTYCGGAIEIMVPWNSPGDLIITNCVFSENTAGRGGAIYNICSSPDITNCTFVKNSSTSRGGAMYNVYSDYGPSSPVVTNCIFWDDSAVIDGNEIYNQTNCDPNFSYCDIEGCKPGGVWDPNFGTDGGGNIDADPCFVGIDANNFHLDRNSPCINTGDPDGDYTGQTDIDGEPRVMTGRVDMGSDEFSGIFNMDKELWYDSIQEAINDANAGDTIEVCPGLYYETVDFNGVSCTVTSTDPNDDDVVAATIIDANGAGRAVTFDSSEDINSVLTGLTITGGYTSGTADGAGIYCYGSSPTISRCVIYDNNSSDDGGGIACDNSSSPSISYCLITSNVAGDGAGICCNNSSSPTISYCDITDNDADDKGGGIYCKANSIPTIKDCEISSNSAYKGGGIYCNSTDVQIERCIISDNQTFGDGADGGGIYCSKSSPNILNCIINDNVSDDDAGGIYCYDNSDPNIINCTLTQNQADDKGGGIYCRNGSDPVITNCILWDDTASTGDEIYTSSSTPVVSYSDIEGGYSGTGNINSDPCFVNPDANDYHLDWDSPCINAGDPNGDYNDLTDIDGQSRLIGSRVDIGADERPAAHNITQNKWYMTIQAALDDAAANDEIVVYPGTYYETIDFNGVACTLRSDSPSDWDVINATIIDANCDASNTGRVVTFENGEGAGSVLTGFTITGGYADGSSTPDYMGGGIYCYNASPTINRCIIIDNKAGIYGGGMCNYSAACPTVTNCLFVNNSAIGNGTYGGYGGGISNLTYSVVKLINCTFSKNSAYIDNSNGGYGGGMFNSMSSPDLTNCIFWDDYAECSGDEVYNSNPSDPNFRYCDVEGCGGSGSWDSDFGNDCGGNIDSDPLFEDPNNDDFHLDSNSPCIDVGYPDGDYTGQTDIDGDNRVIDIPGKGDKIVDVDMGADEYKE